MTFLVSELFYFTAQIQAGSLGREYGCINRSSDLRSPLRSRPSLDHRWNEVKPMIVTYRTDIYGAPLFSAPRRRPRPMRRDLEEWRTGRDAMRCGRSVPKYQIIGVRNCSRVLLRGPRRARVFLSQFTGGCARLTRVLAPVLLPSDCSFLSSDKNRASSDRLRGQFSPEFSRVRKRRGEKPHFSTIQAAAKERKKSTSFFFQSLKSSPFFHATKCEKVRRCIPYPFSGRREYPESDAISHRRGRDSRGVAVRVIHAGAKNYVRSRGHFSGHVMPRF